MSPADPIRRTRASSWRAVVGITAAAVLAAGMGQVTAVASPPSASEVAAQQAEADRLRRELRTDENTVEAARARLEALAQEANAALEAYAVAEATLTEAEASYWEESERLEIARSAVRSTRGEVSRWAAQTYRDGSGMASYEGLMTLLESKSPDDLTQRMTMLRVVGRAQGGTLRQADAAAREQADATDRAQTSAQLVSDAAAAAEIAKAASEELVQAQEAELMQLEALLSTTRDASAQADAEAQRLAEARRAVERGRIESAPAVNLDGLGTNLVQGPVGSCRGGDVQRYPNGKIPRSELCPLWGAPGHLLRADAAHAFDQLAEAFARDHGKPLCVTDSYRTYESQVRLKQSKPHLAATPGRSNHGWGTAVDLCGGIQRFGTKEHRWMQVNAPLYGWFNPAWAQQGGSKPEPWHWEYGWRG